MAINNTALRYGGVTKFFHWLTALLIATLIGLGFYASDLPFETQAQLTEKAWFFSLHKTLGITVFFVALLRIFWAFSQPKPGLLNADRKAESLLAETIHWVLYASLIIVPLAGWISHAAASGFAPIWWLFGQNLPFIPKNTDVEHAFGALHEIAGKVLIGAVILHILGALKHHFIDGDSTLRRMLPGEPAIGPVPAKRHSRMPVVAAVAIWVLAVILGLALGLLGGEGQTQAAEAPPLRQVTSQWQVQDGTIGLTVTQFGTPVDGSFADWTASISFDDQIDTGKAGEVTTIVAIPSLTLGSVTDQAMGSDFFNANDYPTATFKADLSVASDSFVADGTLTVKDTIVPVSLPFAMTISGDQAQMRGSVTLDRRDFGVGMGVTDTGTLAFDVKIDIFLTATRQGG